MTKPIAPFEVLTTLHDFWVDEFNKQIRIACALPTEPFVINLVEILNGSYEETAREFPTLNPRSVKPAFEAVGWQVTEKSLAGSDSSWIFQSAHMRD